MQTHCIAEQLEFEGFDGHKVVAGFDGGAITSDAGALLLRHVDGVIGLFDRVAACFVDDRDPTCTVHSVRTLVGQRVAAIALGYEDVDDHDRLRHDPVLALLSERLTPKRQDCAVLAGKSTLNRLEHGRLGQPTRYHKIAYDRQALEALFIELFLDAHDSPPEEIVLDLDATDDPLHGHQEGRFFHGYYNCYCYLPLYIFCGRHLLSAKLRRSNIDASAGSVAEIDRIIGQIRQSWPNVRIILRADSGFARDELMDWCETNKVDYVFGLARNPRLERQIAPAMEEASLLSQASAQATRVFRDFLWSTKDSWTRRRRVVGKAEWTLLGANPRFIVTSLKPERWAAQTLYEDLYCARGDMENRIKECQLDLYADRTSAHTMHANQLRLWFASLAYVLICALRRLGLAHTRLAEATCGTIRLKLLKIGAQVRVSVRRIKIAMASACPYADEFALAHARIRAAAR
ncbi:putative transposase for insertion sequence NGRIS-20c [Sinorhizobium fredii NGR234]|uniref:Transposase for insertion sequence NGRIS-20c n=1 Tax=Sinorhizobium fredii (strain NBRC 101917 / NGR234) TaxID=394 RepID=C3M906_SINFN|nr:IS1380-like element ISRsp7 family transposase [Sinorhizobium fredii]ACP24307.1 putative transposase for insertion sequence NGRIS-20f [Sinorhizobium fredii NGR234]ACP25797.1 putative transposase for insertion sequence NGRIS-20d [Sinorhizobium fredii NGR234]ACP26717.1 putative transposase for insertion sequence NGRIS-20c [Sinorhizobium fredii NGR234]